MKFDIDKIAREWAYRIKNGTPDLNNEIHLYELKKLLSEQKYPFNFVEYYLHNLRNRDKIQEVKYEKTVRDLIVTKLGSRLGLSSMATDGNLANTSGEDPKNIAKAVSKELGVKVSVIKPNEPVLHNNGKTMKVSSQFNALHFKYKDNIINLKLSAGSGSPDIPKDAAWYEMGICVEYNKSKGMSRDAALNAANVNSKKYSTYEAHLTKVCSKVVKNLGNVGSSLQQTGGESFSSAAVWPSSDGTPKTDIYGGAKERISVKKKGGSQLVSGKASDAKGVFLGALEFYQKYSQGNSQKYIQSIISSIDSDFKNFNTDRSVGTVRTIAGEDYIKWRTPLINKELSKKKIKLTKGKSAERHAKAEAIGAGIIKEMGNWNEWFIDDVSQLTSKKVTSWFSGYAKSQVTKDMKEEVGGIIGAAMDHKRIDVEFKRAFEDNDFKKWAVYEAASGNYKFSGNDDLSSSNKPIANKILVFGLDGSAEVKQINESWASSYISNVSSVVAFKSSGRSKFTAFRLLSEIKDDEPATTFENDVSDIINEELNNFKQEFEFTSLIEEGLFDNLKNIGKKLISKISNTVKNFYSNVIKKIISKLQSYAKAGINSLADALGFNIDGTSYVKVNF